jgi:DNA-binding response OmpR family regulator
MDNRTVLVVDDSSVIRLGISILLENLEARVLMAHDETSFMSIVVSESYDIDLVVMDLTLIDGNGYELIQKMREIEKYKDTPVIILTAHGDIENVKMGQMLNIFDLVVKPYDTQDFLRRITKALKASGK